MGSGVGTISGYKDYGITDFVLYHAPQTYNVLSVCHFNPNQPPDTQPYQTLPHTDTPLNVTLPQTDTADPYAGRTLSFDLDLTQLITDTNDAATKIQEAKNLRYIQVNIVATDLVPTDQTSVAPKSVDSFGDTRNPSEQGSFLEIDLNQVHTYQSSDSGGQLSPEPAGDLFVSPNGSANNSLDLISWSIEVLPTG